MRAIRCCARFPFLDLGLISVFRFDGIKLDGCGEFRNLSYFAELMNKACGAASTRPLPDLLPTARARSLSLIRCGRWLWGWSVRFSPVTSPLSCPIFTPQCNQPNNQQQDREADPGRGLPLGTATSTLFLDRFVTFSGASTGPLENNNMFDFDSTCQVSSRRRYTHGNLVRYPYLLGAD